MFEKILNNKIIILYLLPLSLGLLTVFSYQPFNYSIINFFLLPILFFIIVYVKKRSKSTYRKKPYLKNLFVIGFSLGGRYDNIIVEKIGKSAANLASGELLQFEHIGNFSTTPEDYYAIVDGKTAGPFAAACACAGIIAGANSEIIGALEDFGIEIGRAFQLVDDLLDLTGKPSMGKPRGTDVYDGKMTLPLIHALTLLYGPEREQLEDILNNFSDDRWQELTVLLNKSNSLMYVKQLIKNHINRAIVSLEKLPDSDAKNMMMEIAIDSQNRKL